MAMGDKIMNKFILCLCLIGGLSLLGCNIEKDFRDFRNELSKHNFYEAVYRQDIEWVENHLKAGYDPNRCRGDAGWYDSIPLKVLSEQLVGRYKLVSEGKLYREPDKIIYPGLDVFYLLVKYGADINKFPFVWQRIYGFNNEDLDELWGYYYSNDLIPIELKRNRNSKNLEKIYDINLLIEAFLKEGADPNMKGHPFPFSHSRRLLFFSDKKAFKYFNSPEATTPLYEAIKKGIVWESQVDLLLEYGAVLDETCLEAARLSGDEEMVEKINKLWEDRKE